jgi:hypothetical protein
VLGDDWSCLVALLNKGFDVLDDDDDWGCARACCPIATLGKNDSMFGHKSQRTYDCQMKLAGCIMFAVSVSAYPWLRPESSQPLSQDPKSYKFEPPSNTAIRGPCTGLNTLSNHGFLDREGGKNTMWRISNAMAIGFGIGDSVGLFQTFGSLTRGVTKLDGLNGVVLNSLSDLTESHGRLEHDASITRIDNALGGKEGPNGPPAVKALIEQTLAFSSDGVYLTVEELARAQALRMKQTLENNPLKEKALTDRDLGSLYRGKALITQFAGRRSNEWKMRVDWLRTWLIEERLPWELGWTPEKTNLIDHFALTKRYEKLIQAELKKIYHSKE